MNLLNIAMPATAILGCNKPFTFLKYKETAPDAIGRDVPVFETPVTLTGSIQPVSNKMYEQMGLDLNKNYKLIYSSALMQSIAENPQPDRIVYENRTYEIVENKDWFKSNGWAKALIVELKNLRNDGTTNHIQNQNQVYSDFISLVNASLEAFEVKGWQVRQLEQIFKINVLKPSVYLTVINTGQRGRQYSKNTKQDGNLFKKYSKKQEISIKFSAARREQMSDTVQTFNAEDILELVKSFMQSDEGIKLLAAMGYAQYRADEVSSASFLNDEDNFQFMPSFSCTFVYTGSFTVPVNEITKVREKGIYKI